MNLKLEKRLVDGVSVGAVAGYTFSNVAANHTIAASFAIDQNTITAPRLRSMTPWRMYL